MEEFHKLYIVCVAYFLNSRINKIDISFSSFHFFLFPFFLSKNNFNFFHIGIRSFQIFLK